MHATNFIFDLGPHWKVHCMVKADTDNRVIHVLDCHGPSSVTNFIERIQVLILERLELLGPASQWNWSCYGTDGVICEYNEGFGRFIREPGVMMDPDFAERMTVLAFGVGAHLEHTSREYLWVLKETHSHYQDLVIEFK